MPEPSADILLRFTEAAPSEAGFQPGEGAVLALSGGPDSTALLDLFLRAGAPPERLVAAHMDHALRPASHEDALFVAEQARGAGIRGRCRRRDVRDLAGTGNVEEKARELRYEFLGELAAELGIPVIATGHHRDDQAETVLMRLLRGAGPTGLRAIAPVRPLRPGSPVRLVRPLLPFTREEIVRYLAMRGLPYRVDPTNLDGSNLRSRVRTRLLPSLAREVPDLAARLAGLADRARELPATDTTRPLFPALTLTAAMEAGGGVLRAALRSLLPEGGPAVDRGAVDRVRGIVARGRGTADLGGGWSALVERGRLLVLPPGPAPRLPEALLPCPGEATLADGARLTATPVERAERPSKESHVEIVDALASAPPFRIRPAAEGMAFRPFGRTAETTVLRFLKGQGVTERVRRRVPVVWSRGLDRPVWVVGYRIDARVAIRPETKERIRLTMTSSSPRPPRPSRRRPG